tara:strand:+ start:183 stop:773 length:591 start_codon:yes stop_codon:yes gene_type:complete
MRGKAMLKICKKLLDKGIKLETFTALEFFAREGGWQTKSYSNLVKNLYAWEIDQKFKKNLTLNHPNAFIKIGDSFVFAKKKEFEEKFDFLVFDNPQSIYNGYCEHFEALENAYFLLKDFGIVIFNVNKKPFDYNPESDWAFRRNQYYAKDATNLSSQFIKNFYRKLFIKMNFQVIEIFEEKRNEEYLSYLVLMLSK